MTPEAQAGRTRGFASTLGWIVAAGIGLRLVWILLTPGLPVSDFRVYHELAESVAEGHGYSLDGMPTSYRPPGYPLFLALVYRMFGVSMLAGQLANLVLAGLTVLLTGLLGRRLLSDRRGLMAAGMVAALPSLVLYPGLLASENLALPLLLGGLGLMLRPATPAALGAGALLGLALLVRPALAVFPVAWVVAMRVYGKPLRFRFAAAAAAAAILVLTPWAIRNTQVQNGFVPVSTNGGVNLAISFGPESTGGFVDLDRAQFRTHPGATELEIDREARRRALQYVRENPAEVLRLAPKKLYYLLRDDVSGVTLAWKETRYDPPRWMYLGLLAACMAGYAALWLLALRGAWDLRRDRVLWLLAAPLAACVLTHLVFFGDDRLHHPMLPFLALLAAAAPGWRRPANPTS